MKTVVSPELSELLEPEEVPWLPDVPGLLGTVGLVEDVFLTVQVIGGNVKCLLM